MQSVALQRNTGGCLDETPAAGLPHYALSPAQRTALLAYLPVRATRASPAQSATDTLKVLNCVACHERDGQGGPDAARKPYFLGDHNLGDTGRFPPPLTGIGRKLQPEWLAQALAGALAHDHVAHRGALRDGGVDDLLEGHDLPAAPRAVAGDDDARLRVEHAVDVGFEREAIAVGAAIPPTATELSRLTSTETSYVQAWLKARTQHP